MRRTAAPRQSRLRERTMRAWWCVLALAVAVLAAGAGARALDDDMAELAAMVRDNCAGETGVDLALVEAVNAGGELGATSDATLKCYIKCTMEMAGMLSEGAVDAEAVVALMPPAMAAQCADGIRACGTKKGGDDCETAYLTQLCWQNSNKALFFLI